MTASVNLSKTVLDLSAEPDAASAKGGVQGEGREIRYTLRQVFKWLRDDPEQIERAVVRGGLN